MDLVHSKLKCHDCSCPVFVVDDHPTNDSSVVCKQCGTVFGTFKRFKRDAVNDAMDSILRQTVQRLKKRF